MAIKTTHKGLWKKLREQADQAVRRGHPAYILDDGYSGDEQLELRFHPEQQAERLGTAFVAKGAKAVLRIEPLSTDGVHVSGESLPLPGRQGGKQCGLFAICLATQRAAWHNAVALSWCPAEREPTKVALRTEAGRWTFVVGKRKLVLDWDAGKVD